MIPIGSILGGVNVLSGLLSPLAGSARPEEPAQPAAAGPLKSPKPHPEPPPGADAALRKVLARYDVTQITPRQYACMLEELKKTGALAEEELNQLGQVLLELDAEHIDLDEQIDLVKFYTDKLDKLQDRLQEEGSDEAAFAGIATSLAAIQNRLNWLTKFALLHSAPDAAGVNLLT